MYFANMYCYGWDYNAVGITGIRGCMGVVFKGVRALYAVHIPDNGPEMNALGGKTFADYVVHAERNGTKNGALYLFVNGKNRLYAEDEARAIKSILKGPVTKVYRLQKHLGKQSGEYQADSAVIRVEHRITGLEMTYKNVADNAWVTGGKNKIGMYKEDPRYAANTVPNDTELAAGWHDVDDANCFCINIK